MPTVKKRPAVAVADGVPLLKKIAAADGVLLLIKLCCHFPIRRKLAAIELDPVVAGADVLVEHNMIYEI